MRQFLKTFTTKEDGAVSTDWVVITAAIMLFAGATAVTIKSGAETGATNIENQVAAMATP